MKIPRVTLSAQVRTVSCSLPAIIARALHDKAADLESLTEPAQCTVAIVETCQGLVDATRAALGLDRAHDALVEIARALDGHENCDLSHIAVREARDLRIRCAAVRKVAPEFEMPDLDEFREELQRATGKVDDSRKASWEAVHEAARVVSWTIFLPLGHCSDLGLALRTMARAGILPHEIDRHLAFAKRPDKSAPEGSPARNSADALVDCNA